MADVTVAGKAVVTQQRMPFLLQKKIPHVMASYFAVYLCGFEPDADGIRHKPVVDAINDSLIVKGEKDNHWRPLSRFFTPADHLVKSLKDTAKSLGLNIELGCNSSVNNTSNILLVLDQFKDRGIDLSGMEVRQTPGGQYLVNLGQDKTSYTCFGERVLYLAKEISEVDCRESMARLLLHMCNYKNSEDTMVMRPASEQSQAWITDLAGGRPNRSVDDVCAIIAARCIETGKPIIEVFDADTLGIYKALGGVDLFPNMGAPTRPSAT
ncbi:MAG: hypothetical protein KTR20_03865 [Cellvibrionaceae bacterium]|nr:hypothetical protein [Cellvibrionaceae bacterium]